MRATRGIEPETKAEAAAWLVRLHADDRCAADEHAFHAWLAARPENARAFEAVTSLWDLADGLHIDTAASQVSPTSPRLVLRRRTLLAGLGSLAAAGAGFAVWDDAYAGVYETDVGEQKHVTLSDGTQAFLDTDTRIRERYTSSLRKVDLDWGRADFRVRLDMNRPFVVETAGQQILTGQTTFDVRRDGSRVSFVLLDGRATVVANMSRRVSLARGERAIVAENVAVHVDKPNLAPLTAWQTGQAMFESETLSAAVSEMNRYSTARLVVDDPSIANLKISGVYRVGDNEAFAHSVSLLLPVTIEHYSDHIELVRDESRMPQG